MNTDIATTDQAAEIIEKSVDIFRQAPAILQKNMARKEKAIAVGQKYLTVIEQTGMTKELDEKCQGYLANINQAIKEFKEERLGVTQIMDNMKKMYTSVENELDIKKADTIPGQIQAHRNAYVEKIAREAEQKRIQLENERKKKEEAITIKSTIASFIANELIGFLAAKKQKMTVAFNGITLDDYGIKSAALKGMPTGANMDEVRGSIDVSKSTPAFTFHHHSEVKQLQVEVLESYDWNAFERKYQEEILMYKTELSDKLPSKLAELQEAKQKEEEAAKQRELELERQRVAEEQRRKELEAAKDKAAKEALELQQQKEREEEENRLMKMQQEAEQARLAAEQERKDREAAEQQRIINEQEAQKKQAQQEIDIQTQGEITMNMFEQEAQLAEAGPTPETRQGYSIKVTHPVGYTQLFAFWFEKEGKNLPMDKIERTTFAQIRTWCEKFAHKTEEKINSQFLKYEISYKAVNRKED